MWIKSAFGSIGHAFKEAISEAGEIFKKVQRDISDKISTAVTRITSKDAPKGTKSKVEIRGNQITVEIETPDKAIKDDIRESGKQAEKKVEWRLSEHAKELAEQNTLKSLHDAIFGKLWLKRWNKAVFGIMSIKGLNSLSWKSAIWTFSVMMNWPMIIRLCVRTTVLALVRSFRKSWIELPEISSIS